jgi:hypothetical protein
MQDQDAPISIRFLEDLTDLLREFGTPEESFVHMGFMSHFTNLGSPLAEKLSKSDSVRDLHEHLFSEYIQLYEKNHDYRIVQLTDRSIVFASRQRKEVLDALDRKRFGSHSICMMRLGTTISLPGYLGLPYGQGKHTHCVHRGDPECRFEIEFPDPVRRPSSGLSAVPNR